MTFLQRKTSNSVIAAVLLATTTKDGLLQFKILGSMVKEFGVSELRDRTIHAAICYQPASPTL
jgi:hypothetical protein